VAYLDKGLSLETLLILRAECDLIRLIRTQITRVAMRKRQLILFLKTVIRKDIKILSPIVKCSEI
jgi:hypothetical protein